MARDPLRKDVALHLSFDGANGATTFVDKSPAPKTVTAFNGAQISTARSVFGGASGMFDGSNDYLTAGAATDWKFLHDGSTDFAIEGFVYWAGGASQLTLLSTAAGSVNVGFILQVMGADSRKLSVQIYRGVTGSSLSATSTVGITAGAWTYIKFGYTKTTGTYAFRIGSSDAGSGSMTVAGAWPSASTLDPSFTLAIGRYQYSTPGGYLMGNLDELRITRAARTETIEPTAAFPETAPVHKAIDRCKESTSTSGAGNLTLTGPVGGYVGVADAVTGLVDDLDTSWFCAEVGAQWEVFLGTRLSATVLERTAVLASSNGGAPVNFESPPVVFSTVPAARIDATGPAVSAYRGTSSQSITSNSWTKVQLNAETFDTHAAFDSAANHRFQPTVAGYYDCNFAVYFTAASGMTQICAGLFKNGSMAAQGACVAPPSPTLGSSGGSKLVYLNGGSDYLELYGYALGTNPSVSAAEYATFLTCVFVRAG